MHKTPVHKAVFMWIMNASKLKKMKRIFIIDWSLLPSFILSVYTGTELHVAGHGNNHKIWHDWAVFHVIVSSLFLILMVHHLITHRNWYKGIVSGGSRKEKQSYVMAVYRVCSCRYYRIYIVGCRRSEYHDGIMAL